MEKSQDSLTSGNKEQHNLTRDKANVQGYTCIRVHTYDLVISLLMEFALGFLRSFWKKREHRRVLVLFLAASRASKL